MNVDWRQPRSLGVVRTRTVVHLFDLLRELVSRDLKIRYKRSVLGILWAVAMPLAQLLVFGFLFGQVMPSRVVRFSSYVLCGLLVWTWLQTSLILAAGSITDNRELIKRPGFPSAVLPGVTVATNLIHFLMALPILFVFLLFDGTRFTLAVLALPVVIALQFILTLAVAYFVAALNVTFRDTGHLLAMRADAVVLFDSRVLRSELDSGRRICPSTTSTRSSTCSPRIEPCCSKGDCLARCRSWSCSGADWECCGSGTRRSTGASARFVEEL